jgi:glycosyltransferase WbpL
MIIVFVLVAGVSFLGTAAMRRYAIARGMLDVPNHRSSHRTPTPSGGGVAIVGALFCGLLVCVAFGRVAPSTAIAIFGGGTVVAVVGFLDDRRPMPARWRLLAHFAAVATALIAIGGMPSIELGGVFLPGWIANVAASVAMVWLLNLYNFMDGIDGIAAIEALTVTCAAAALHWASPPLSTSAALLPTLVALSVLGFLVWNFPPAKIFMGDSGSGFLGLVLGVLAVRDTLLSPRWLWIWTILLGVFVVDATTTLIARAVRGERVYEAHRSHAYQRAASRLGGHRAVTVAVGLINLLWLFPWALLVDRGGVDGRLAVGAAYLPLVVLTWYVAASRGHVAEPAGGPDV